MYIIDTHTHLYLEEFKTDIDEVIKRALEEGVSHFYLPNIDSTSIPHLLALEKRFLGKCIALMGLHPCSVNENYKEELKTVAGWLQKRPFAGIGEIGLDYYWDKTFIPQQKEVFQQQIEWGLQFNYPIIIHSRDSLNDCIDIVGKNQNGKLKGIFHCFGGTIDEARKIIDLGFLMGIGGVITYKNSGLSEVVKQIPLEHLVIETDAPYLTPVPFRGKRNEPSYCKYIVETLAKAKETTIQEVAVQTTKNAVNLFGQSD